MLINYSNYKDSFQNLKWKINQQIKHNEANTTTKPNEEPNLEGENHKVNNKANTTIQSIEENVKTLIEKITKEKTNILKINLIITILSYLNAIFISRQI